MSLIPHADEPAFSGHKDLYSVIDATTVGEAPWRSFSAKFSGEIPEGKQPSWMTASYDVWYRDPRTILRTMLANPDFDGEIHYSPTQEFNAHGEREWKDLMSGNWAWNQAVSSSCFIYLYTINDSFLFRILLHKILRHMAQCLCQ